MSTLSCPRLPFELRVVGVSFHADSVARVRVGDSVLIAHEPDNPHDANAVAVLVNDELVGHAPRALAARMVTGRSRSWTGVVTEVSAGRDLPTGLVVSVTAESDQQAPATVPIREEPEATPQQDGPLVYARSGRELGRLVDTTDTHILVDTGATVVPYPRDLVRMAS